MTDQELIKHLQIQHGFEHEVDQTPEEMEGGYGLLRVDHPLWERKHLEGLHEQDHQDYPDTGTPVRGWAHRHKI